MHINSLKLNNLILYVHSKGQLISKGLCGILYCPKKRTKKFDFTTMIPQVDLFLFIFWKKLKTKKKDISKLTDLQQSCQSQSVNSVSNFFFAHSVDGYGLMGNSQKLLVQPEQLLKVHWRSKFYPEIIFHIEYQKYLLMYFFEI